jgi:hypothetical protein
MDITTTTNAYIHVPAVIGWCRSGFPACGLITKDGMCEALAV